MDFDETFGISDPSPRERFIFLSISFSESLDVSRRGVDLLRRQVGLDYQECLEQDM